MVVDNSLQWRSPSWRNLTAPSIRPWTSRSGERVIHFLSHPNFNGGLSGSRLPDRTLFIMFSEASPFRQSISDRLSPQSATASFVKVGDGQQRISAVLDFLEGDYRLSRTLKADWAGKTFDKLGTNERDRIGTYSFSVEIFHGTSDLEVLRYPRPRIPTASLSTPKSCGMAAFSAGSSRRRTTLRTNTWSSGGSVRYSQSRTLPE